MGWSIGYDEKWKRDIGYGVPAICDHPDCHKEIHRGLAHVCGDAPYGGENGCGLYFCAEHLCGSPQLCKCCGDELYYGVFKPKPDTKEWRDWKRTDDSWAKWREENPKLAAAL